MCTIDINEYAEDCILLGGLGEAIVGVTEEFGGTRRVLYSKEKILEILMSRESMTREEAIEYYDFNIIGLYAGEKNPIFLETKLECVLKDTKVEYKIVS